MQIFRIGIISQWNVKNAQCASIFNTNWCYVHDALEFLLNQAELNEAMSVGKIIIQSLSLAEYRTEGQTLYCLLQKFQRWFKQDDKLRKFRGVINYVRATKEVERKNGEDTEDLRQCVRTHGPSNQ